MSARPSLRRAPACPLGDPRREAPAEKASPELRNSCFPFPCRGSCFIPGDCSAGSVHRKRSGPPRGFQGRQSEAFPLTPLGVVIHPGNDSGSPASCRAVLDRLPPAQAAGSGG